MAKTPVACRSPADTNTRVPPPVPGVDGRLQHLRFAPRLRERLRLDSQLADDAGERGWEREVDRHQRIAERIRGLLTELGEPSDPPGGEP